jgi:hypothetical protein
MKLPLIPLVMMAFATMASAQPAAKDDPALETVIVTAPRYDFELTPDAVAHDFIRNYAAPAPFLGKFARWNRRNPICPSAGGFLSGYDRFTVKRIKDVAAMVGAPVSQKPGCKPNMAIIVTKDAQGLMSEIRAHRTDLLGYHQSNAQADSLATMRFPVQVLYETATIDVNGHVVVDDRLNDCPCATTGWRARDGLQSAFFNVTIVVDAAKVDAYRLQIGALADYLAMLALSQTENFTPCEQLPSISSLMTPDCGISGLANTLTATDVAYLKGVYTMDSGGSPIAQRSGIASEVEKSLTSAK